MDVILDKDFQKSGLLFKLTKTFGSSTQVEFLFFDFFYTRSP